MKRMLRMIRMIWSNGSAWSRWVIGLLIFFAVFGDFIANDKPVYCKVNGRMYFPIFRAVLVEAGLSGWPSDLEGGKWKMIRYERVVYTLIPYSPSGIDSQNGNFRKPFGQQNIEHWRFRHWLGTDALGRDVSAGLIRGCRIALVVGVMSMLIALLIGVPLGVRAGYYGDSRKLKPWPVTVLWILVILLGLWYIFQSVVSILRFSQLDKGLLLLGIAALLFTITALCDQWLSSRLPRSMLRGVPWDFTVLRGVEVIRSMPAFFLLFALMALLANPSISSVVILIGVLRAPTVIRYIRAEAIRIRDMGYVDSARVVGLSDRQILRRHIIPNAMGPVMITIAFGIGGAVLLESGLSFLGIGLSIDQMSWGRLLNEARSNFAAWWLAVLPGMAIFLTVAAFNRIGEDITKWLEEGR